MTALAEWLLSATLSTGATLALVLLARCLLAARLDARAGYALWLAVPLQMFVLLPGIQPALPAPIPALLPTLGVSAAAPGPDAGALSAAAVAIAGWLAGLGLMLARLGVHLARANALTAQARPVPRQPAASPSMPRAALQECHRIQTPLVAGLFRPRILVPPGFLDAGPPATVALILEHEACHLRRRDNLINLVAELILAVQWFNPLAWIAMRAFRTDQEVSADAEALTRSNTPAGRYARALLELAGRTASPALTSAWLALPSLQRRITMLDHHRPARLGALVAGLSLALTVALTGTALGAGGDRPAADRGPAVTEDPVVVVRINPRYPVDAAENGIEEGFVTAEFTITEAGRVADIVVMDSEPGQTFVPEAITALARWRFKPRTVDGVRVPHRATQKIEFKLD